MTPRVRCLVCQQPLCWQDIGLCAASLSVELAKDVALEVEEAL